MFGENNNKPYICTRKGLFNIKFDVNTMPISLAVKELRKKYNLTQEDLAMKSGVGLRFLRELEQGKPTVRLDKVNQVLNLFNKEVGVCDKERFM